MPKRTHVHIASSQPDAPEVCLNGNELYNGCMHALEFHQVACIQGLKTPSRTKGASAEQAGTPHTSEGCGYLSILVYLLTRDEHDKGLAPPACSLGEN